MATQEQGAAEEPAEEQPGVYEQQPYEEHQEYLGDANFGWGAYPEQGRHLCIPPSK